MIVGDPGLFYAYSAAARVMEESSTRLNLIIKIKNRLCNSTNTSPKLAERVKLGQSGSFHSAIEFSRTNLISLTVTLVDYDRTSVGRIESLYLTNSMQNFLYL